MGSVGMMKHTQKTKIRSPVVDEKNNEIFIFTPKKKKVFSETKFYILHQNVG